MMLLTPLRFTVDEEGRKLHANDGVGLGMRRALGRICAVTMRACYRTL
ncbi:hypothetical protein FHS27_000486 [Rhodopirellula rubra]|uniref:Uncharacterized protein n=1 Tax=Aporhodopirellula rubra TaxID=980271 RepID=A0A7W5DUD1_9BACT|nr:hypothetical protein [Aporhodopirellula rubra]MBB3204719.1 hypothetical protein [Aporhodopirellula rubra]